MRKKNFLGKFSAKISNFPENFRSKFKRQIWGRYGGYGGYNGGYATNVGGGIG